MRTLISALFAFLRAALMPRTTLALENAALLRSLMEEVALRRGKRAPSIDAAPKSEQYDRLADWFEQSADMELFEELYLQ